LKAGHVFSALSFLKGRQPWKLLITSQLREHIRYGGIYSQKPLREHIRYGWNYSRKPLRKHIRSERFTSRSGAVAVEVKHEQYIIRKFLANIKTDYKKLIS